ncbi:MAG TPA: DUF1440 domain-containing protein [Bryobacteraceae bacterium]|nr:DUF1440 domain-containing protein [Bryobacteraceae bacterium]
MRIIRKHHPAKDALAGMAGGLAGAFLMNQFQAALAKLKSKQEGPQDREAEARQGGGEPEREAADEPATVKAAVAVSTAVLKRELRREEKGPAGDAVHYLFGTAIGGLYGVLAGEKPAARAGFGALFGSLLWLVSDEIAVPALGLAKSPRAYPASVHASALGAHLVYGITTEVVRRGLRAP